MQFVLELSRYKCAIFDCDGVILQSNELKSNAFRESLKGEPNALIDLFVLYHKSNGGVSRYVKFEHYYRDIKNEAQYKSMAEAAINRYAAIVAEQLMLVDYVPGVMSVVDYFNSHNIPCYIVSGGDQRELCDIFVKRSIFNKFVKIFGSPDTKEQNFNKMLDDGHLYCPAIYFGDARSDMDVALINEIEFCFVSQFSEWDDGKMIANEFGCEVIDNFDELI